MSVNRPRTPLDSLGENLFDGWNPERPALDTVARPQVKDSLEWLAAPATRPRPLDETMARPEFAGLAKPAEDANDFVIRGETPPGNRPLPGGRPSIGPRADLDTATLDTPDRPIVFPKLGEAIGGFRLVSELGRGAFARVYLAHEVELGNRPVALKVSKAEGDEPKILARLQHTHIVPIHSVHDDRATKLRLMCMPYFGGANLAQVLEAAGARSPIQGQGRSLVDALDLIGQPAVTQGSPRVSRVLSRVARLPSILPEEDAVFDVGPHPSHAATLHRSLLGRIPWWPRTRSLASIDESAPPVENHQAQPARQFLCESSYVRASAWIMARLAEGLEHAHSRGLLHRDLKPSNILVAADGTPMLLDFNLAANSEEPAHEEEEGAKAMMGGTLPYMSPEHLDAFNPRGSTPPGAVDERSDVYALGLILFEMIAGRPTFAEPPPGLGLIDLLGYLTAERRRGAPSLRSVNPEVPWSLDAIVAKCLDPISDRRYRSASELAEDLRRYLEDLPLKFTPEPSLRERMAKWSRRHPRASSAWTIGPIALALTLAAGAVAWTQAAHLRQVAARLNLRRFHEAFGECQFLLNTASAGDLTDHLRRGIDKSRAAIDRYGVSRRGDWDKSYWVASLTLVERTGLRQDLAELILLEARARVALAEKEGTENDRRKALEWAVAWLDRAERFDPAPSPALLTDRARYHHALGQADKARDDRARAATTPSASCRDEYLLGTADLAAGRADRAEARLNRAVALEPDRFWAWFALGLCHFDQGRYSDAVGDFNVCTVLMPRFAWPFVNRGFALARAGRLAEAIDSFDRALSLSPAFGDALAGRGLAHLEAGHPDQAERDLARVIEQGRRDPNLRAGRAEALAKLRRRDEALAIYADLIADRPQDARLLAARGMIRVQADPTAAEADFNAALAIDPALSLAHHGLARLRSRSDRPAALAHADAALRSDPRSFDAIELRALIRAHLGRPDTIDDVDRLVLAPTPNRLYNAACALAVLARTRKDVTIETRAIDLLRRAIETGFPAEPARSDPDLKSLHPRAEFRKLVGLGSAE